MSHPRLDEVERVARATVTTLLSAGIRSCLVGGMACSIYGNSRVPNDVDIVCLTDKHTQEELKGILVANDINFYTIASKDPLATYRVLWYRLGFRRSCKVDVLLPGVMNIPPVPRRGWTIAGPTSFILGEKQHVDVRDIGELLDLAVEKYDVNVKRDGKSLPESFLRAAVTRMKAYVKSFPNSAEHWRDIGFHV
ncbi:Helicase ATP-binding domain-containing protein [Mycena venus]|uniref:Helicase ATP-binding domain-containing protein n=1 Tax=Mycena venus TaxID=2733690 RepID=A0A8H7CVC4_9AGAR|nr:Helicase ATP-binding domain-containing protein [Mycena venus]